MVLKNCKKLKAQALQQKFILKFYGQQYRVSKVLKNEYVYEIELEKVKRCGLVCA